MKVKPTNTREHEQIRTKEIMKSHVTNIVTQNPTTHHVRSRIRRLFPRLSLGLVAAIAVGTAAPRAIGGDRPYHFQAVRYIGDPATGGGALVNDFEISALNNRGE